MTETCGRYGFSSETIVAAANVLNMQNVPTGFPDRDVHPGEYAPVFSATGLQNCMWGYPGFEKGQLIFNTRTESALEKRMFQSGVTSGRVLIAAACFYEWDARKEMFRFSDPSASVLFLAGISQIFDGIRRYSILTTEPNASVRLIHMRMPLILAPEEALPWLDNDSAAIELLHKTPALLHAERTSGQTSLFDQW